MTPPHLARTQRAAATPAPILPKSGPIRLATCVMTPTLLGGCSIGAPSFNLFGAFFPAWLLCAVLGILCGIIARVIFAAKGFATTLPFQLFVCTAIGILSGSLIWLLFFG